MRSSGARVAMWCALLTGVGGCMFFADFDDLGPAFSAIDGGGVLVRDGAASSSSSGDAAARDAAASWCPDGSACDDFEGRTTSELQGSIWGGLQNAAGALSIETASPLDGGQALSLRYRSPTRDEAYLLVDHEEATLSGCRVTFDFWFDGYPESGNGAIARADYQGTSVRFEARESFMVITNGDVSATVLTLQAQHRYRLQLTATQQKGTLRRLLDDGSWDTLAEREFAASSPNGKATITLGWRGELARSPWQAFYDRVAVEFLLGESTP